MDESRDEIARLLKRDNYVVLDGFLLEEQAAAVRAHVVAHHERGELTPGGIVDNSRKAGTNKGELEIKSTVRGDLIGWFDADEGTALHRYGQKAATLVTEVSERVPELKCINGTSKFMCGCYPPGGAYVKHWDNDGKAVHTKPRRLTVLLYLNPEWKAGDGGELAVYGADDADRRIATVAPRQNRILMFFSDKRVPHEVLASNTMRYACTLWFCVKETDGEAQAAADAAEDKGSTTAEANGKKTSTAEANGKKTSAEKAITAALAERARLEAQAAEAMARVKRAQEDLERKQREVAEAEVAKVKASDLIEEATAQIQETGLDELQPPPVAAAGYPSAPVADPPAPGEEVVVELSVPWAASLGDIEVFISATTVRATQLTSPGEVVEALVPGSVDVDAARAGFSKKRRVLTVRFPPA
jgi:hypoxia-inducible factor (prolyl hydroxylase)